MVRWSAGEPDSPAAECSHFLGAQKHLCIKSDRSLSLCLLTSALGLQETLCVHVLTNSVLYACIFSETGTVLNRKVRGKRSPAEMLEQGGCPCSLGSPSKSWISVWQVAAVLTE